MNHTDLPPPPVINEDIYINQFTNEYDEPILNVISDDNQQKEDKIYDNNEEEKNEITEGNKEEYSKEISNEIEYIKSKEEKITENPQDEENLINKEPKLNNKDKDNIKMDYNKFEDNITKKNIKINDINNIKIIDNEIVIVDEVKIQGKKRKCNCDCCNNCNCDCDKCCKCNCCCNYICDYDKCCNCDCCNNCCDSCRNCDCCHNCNCISKLTCCNSFDLYNNYKMEISFLIYLIQNIIYLSIFLFFFLDYNDFSFKLMISPAFFIISGIFGGIIFLIIKRKQCNDEEDCLSSYWVSIFFLIGITFCKIIFLLGWPSLAFDDYNQRLKNVAKIYLIYFLFSIIYYFTLTLYVCTKNCMNYLLFLLIAVIYIAIESLIIYFISLVEILLSIIIVCSLEVILLYIGIGLALCRKVLDNETEILNSLHIEIYRLYPLFIFLLFLFSLF